MFITLPTLSSHDSEKRGGDVTINTEHIVTIVQTRPDFVRVHLTSGQVVVVPLDIVGADSLAAFSAAPNANHEFIALPAFEPNLGPDLPFLGS